MGVCVSVTGVNMTQRMSGILERNQSLPGRTKGRHGTWNENQSFCQNMSGFDSALLNPQVKHSTQQSSKCFIVHLSVWKTIAKGEGGKPTQYLSCNLFPSDELCSNIFLPLWPRLGDGWVEESGRWYVSATSTSPLSHISPACNLRQRQ